MTASARAPRRRLAFLVAAGLLAGLLLVELTVRLVTHAPWDYGGPNGDRYMVRDPVVGRLPKPGLSFRHPKGFTMTIGENSTRSNGGDPPRTERPLILAVGDSFAFGDQVNDEDSWPAVLERLSGRRVINAGVPGFGLDQAVLRAEQLADVYHPDIIVVSFIPHDVLRCGMSYWSGRPKPYFDVDDTGLHLHAAPVPPPSVLTVVKRLLSWSVTLDLLFPRFLHWEGPEVVMVHDRDRKVTCALMERLAAFGRAHNVRIIVVAHPQDPDVLPEHAEIKSSVLACARASGLLAVDLFPVFASLTPEQRARLFHGHLTVEGNRLVATELERTMPPRDQVP